MAWRSSARKEEWAAEALRVLWQLALLECNHQLTQGSKTVTLYCFLYGCDTSSPRVIGWSGGNPGQEELMQKSFTKHLHAHHRWLRRDPGRWTASEQATVMEFLDAVEVWCSVLRCEELDLTNFFGLTSKEQEHLVNDVASIEPKHYDAQSTCSTDRPRYATSTISSVGRAHHAVHSPPSIGPAKYTFEDTPSIGRVEHYELPQELLFPRKRTAPFIGHQHYVVPANYLIPFDPISLNGERVPLPGL